MKAQKDPSALLQALYQQDYRSRCAITQQELRARQDIDRCIRELSPRRQHEIWTGVFSLNCALEQNAYLAGLRSGAQLMLQLMTRER